MDEDVEYKVTDEEYYLGLAEEVRSRLPEHLQSIPLADLATIMHFEHNVIVERVEGRTRGDND